MPTLLLASALGAGRDAAVAPGRVLAAFSGAAMESAQPVTQPAEDPSTQPSTQPTTAPASQPTTAPASQPTTSPSTQPTTAPASQPASKPASQPATSPTTKPAEEEVYFAITGGIVHPVSGPDRRDVTILCKDGKIVEIGRHVVVPEGATTIDASGLHVYPGLIACNSFGIVGSGKVEDSTNAFSLNMTLANAGGLTTVVTGNTAAKVSYGSLEGMVLREDLFVNLRARSSADRRAVRETFEEVRQYIRDKAEFDRRKAEGDQDAKAPDESKIKGRNEEYYKLIRREKTALVQADSRTELLGLCELIEHFGFDAVIRGAGEGWTIPDVLGRANVKVIVMPRRIAPRDERSVQDTGGSIEMAAILYRHGVDIAVTSGSGGISLVGLAGADLLNLPMDAAFAVKGGLPEKAAIESITLGAARVLGIDDRVGSIDVGKDADFIITDGRLLEFYSTVQYTIVNGEKVYDKSDESLFAHIRPRPPAEAAPLETQPATTQPATTQPAYKFWPRPFKRKPAPWVNP
jgi:hypothetical protein